MAESSLFEGVHVTEKEREGFFVEEFIGISKPAENEKSSFFAVIPALIVAEKLFPLLELELFPP